MTSTQRYLAAILSGLGMAIPFVYPQCYLLSWCGLVPLIWVVQGQPLLQVYTLALTMGFTMFALAAFCIVDFVDIYNGLGPWASGLLALVFWAYCAQLIGLAFVLVRWLENLLDLPGLWLLPVCVTLFFSRFPMIFPIQLAESQSQFTIALQALDLVGTAGLDFMIVLVNVSLFYLFRRLEAAAFWQLGALLLVCFWFGYGVLMQPVWEQRVAHWPRHTIGLVQSDELPSAEVPPPRPGYSRGYPPEMALTERLVQHDLDLVVWPETRYKGYFSYPWVEQAFHRQLADLQVPLVFQDTEQAGDRGETATFNTAVMLNHEGRLQSRYRKIKRMPFAEYIPGLHLWPGVKRFVYQHFSDFFTDFLPGQTFKRFSLEGEPRDTQIVPLICYEVMLPEFVAQAVQGRERGSAGHVLLVLSNSAWFGDSMQAFQQLNAAVLRSVENRMPMVYVSNRGPSGLVLPSGERVYQSPFFQQLGVVLQVPYTTDNRGSFYSRHPSLLLSSLSWVLFGCCLSACWRWLGHRSDKCFRPTTH